MLGGTFLKFIIYNVQDHVYDLVIDGTHINIHEVGNDVHNHVYVFVDDIHEHVHNVICVVHKHVHDIVDDIHEHVHDVVQTHFELIFQPEQKKEGSNIDMYEGILPSED